MPDFMYSSASRRKDWTGDAADFGVHDLLALAGGILLGALDVLVNLVARRTVIVEAKHVHQVAAGRLHFALGGGTDGDRR